MKLFCFFSINQKSVTLLLFTFFFNLNSFPKNHQEGRFCPVSSKPTNTKLFSMREEKAEDSVRWRQRVRPLK